MKTTITGYLCRVCSNSRFREVVSGIADWEYGYPGSYSYLECDACSSVQIYPFPGLDDLIAAYDVDYHGYAPPSDKGIIYKFLYSAVELYSNRQLKRLVPDKNSKILDVGCGIGLYLSKLRALGYQRIEGIDFNDKAVAYVSNNGIRCHLGTFIDFEAEPASYSLIVMNNYLEHTIDPLSELKKAFSLLKPGGLLMCETPNFHSIDQVLFGKYWGGNHVPRHTFQYTPISVTNLLRRVGFIQTRVTYPLNTSHIALSLQNYRQRNVSDLKSNPNLHHGRERLYPYFMLAFIPVNVLAKIIGMTGFMQFRAYR